MRRAIVLLAFGFGMLSAAGCVAVIGDWDLAQESFHYTYPISAGGTLELQNQNGQVEILGWDQDDVDISGTKYASTTDGLKDIRVDVMATPGAVSIRTLRPGTFWERGSVRYVIRVPRSVTLTRVATANGPIDVEGTDAPAHLQTSNGPVRVRDVRGALDLETSNGPIDVSEDSVAAVHARTSNGPITLRIPSDAGAVLRAHTSHGPVRSDFDVQTNDVNRNDLDGTIGRGGPILDLSTSNGPIQILRR